MLPGVRGGKRTGNCPKVSASASASSDICLWKRTISRGNRPDCLLSAVLRSGPRSWNTTGCSINLRALASESQEVKQSIDLLHNIPKGDHWGTIEQWIVFSDLHVDKKSSKVCCAILQEVHRLALERNAGILFLGDFWQKKSVLPVQPLGDVLEIFKHWKQPTLMLVGNHDQDSADGLQHGLKPIAAACPQHVHIIDQPLLFLGALFCPFRPKQELLLAVEAAPSSVQTFFMHADIKGALVNNTRQSNDGVDPMVFKNVQVYSGHYHRPHVVPNTNIQYVGSSYHVSKGEANQKKALVVLDKNFNFQEKIPIDFGLRYFKFSDGELPDPSEFIPGRDSIDWTWRESEMDKAAMEAKVSQFKARGIHITTEEITQKLKAPRLDVNLPPREFFVQYAERCQMKQETVEKGLELIEKAVESREIRFQHRKTITFDRLEMQGYACFKDLTTYNLGDRGLRVLTGSKGDGSGSNGTGKTTLAMAPLWCLTGRSGGNKGVVNMDRHNNGDVEDHAKKVRAEKPECRVTLSGTLDGKSFTVERFMRDGKLRSLRFWRGDEEITGADTTITQEDLNEQLACHMLPGVVFHGQNDKSLFDANDAEFKNSLDGFCSNFDWEECKDAAKEERELLKTSLNEMKGGQNYHTKTLANYKEKLKQHVDEFPSNEGIRQEIELAEADLETMASDMSSKLAAADWDQLLEGIKQQHVAILSLPPVASPVEMPESLDALDKSEEKKANLDEQLKAEKAVLDKQISRSKEASAVLTVKKKAYKEYSELKLQSEKEVEMECDRCLQNIDEDNFERNIERLRQESQNAEKECKSQENSQKKQKNKVANIEKELDMVGKEIVCIKSRKQEMELKAEAEHEKNKAAEKEREKAKKDLLKMEEKTKNLQHRWRNLVEFHGYGFLTAAADPLGDRPVAKCDSQEEIEEMLENQERVLHEAETVGNDIAIAKVKLKALTDSQTSRLATYDKTLKDIHADIAQAQEELDKAAESVREKGSKAEVLEQVEGAFSRRGIQSFALEGILKEFEALIKYYLKQLTDEFTVDLNCEKPKSHTGKAFKESKEEITFVVRKESALGEAFGHSVGQLSGGERQRVILAIKIAYNQFVGRKTGIECNLLVLDEPMQQLDEEGCMKFMQLLKGMPANMNILLISQSGSLPTMDLNSIDVVVKESKYVSRLEAM